MKSLLDEIKPKLGYHWSKQKRTKSYLIGGPELHDGLSPTVLEYRRMLILSNRSEGRSLPRPHMVPSSEPPYVLCKLSSTVLFFIIDCGGCRYVGNEKVRCNLLKFLRSSSESSLIVIGVLLRCFRSDSVRRAISIGWNVSSAWIIVEKKPSILNYAFLHTFVLWVLETRRATTVTVFGLQE